MSSIIKSRYIKQGSIVDLKDRSLFNYPLDTPEEEQEEEIEMIEEPPIDYNALYEEALKAKEVILTEAKKQANQMMEEARERVKIIEQTTAKESQCILQEANAQAEEMIKVATNDAASITQEAYRTKQNILNEAEPEIVEVIETLVGHIIHEEIARSNKWIAYIVKKMIIREKIMGDLTVYVSPEVLESVTEEEYQELGHIKNEVTLRADEEVNNTTCIVETSEGSILYDISEGLDKIITDLTMLKQLKVEKVYD